MEYLRYADGITVEIDDGNGMGIEQFGEEAPANEKIAELGESFSGVCDDLKRIIDSLSSKISEIEIKPDAVELSLGVKLTAAAGVVIAQAGTEGTMGVKITWKKE